MIRLGELCTNVGKTSSRFIEEMVFGLSVGGSVRLTEIGRFLEEDIALHATHHRGVLVYDRGGDRREFLAPWTKDSSYHYIIRQRRDRNLLYRGKSQSGLD